MAEKSETWIGQFYVKIFNGIYPDAVHTILLAYTNKDLDAVRKELLEKHGFAEIKNEKRILCGRLDGKKALLSADFEDCRTSKSKEKENYPKRLPMKLTITLAHKDVALKNGELDEKTNEKLIRDMRTRFEKKIYKKILENAPDAQY